VPKLITSVTGKQPRRKERDGMDVSEQVLERETVHRDFGSVEERFASLAGGGQESLLLLVGRGASAVLARAQEDADLEAQDVLSQADEALVMG
jgi:hypothetical protein